MAITLKPTDNVKLKNGNNVFVIKKKNGDVAWKKCKPVTFTFESEKIEHITVVGDGVDTEVLSSGTTLNLPCGDEYTLIAVPKSGYLVPSEDKTISLLNIASLTLSDFESANCVFKAETSSSIMISNASFFYDTVNSVITVKGSNETSKSFAKFFIYFYVYQGANKGYIYVGEYLITNTLAPGQSFTFTTSPITTDKFDYDCDEDMAQKLIVSIMPFYYTDNTNYVLGTETWLYGSKANIDWAESESTTTGSVHLGDESTTSCGLTIN